MQTNAFPRNDTSENTTKCCPRFKPKGWDNQQLHFEGEEMTTLSGDFVTRVLKGPYRRTKDVEHDLKIAVSVMGKVADRVYFFYTTCPNCAKAYGENYIVGVAEV